MVCTTSDKLQELFKDKFRFPRTKIFLKESFTIFTSSSLLSSSLAYVHVEDTRYDKGIYQNRVFPYRAVISRSFAIDS